MKNKLPGKFLSPYIIAEIGVNHEGSIELAKDLIDQAAIGGAHAAKFQTYKAEKIASKNSPAYWDRLKEKTPSQYELFKKYDNFGAKEYEMLATHCEKRNIDFLSTPFDTDAVDFLNPLLKYFKIASADITNVPLLRKIASTNKPVVLSTGASTIPEIEFAIQVLEKSGAKEIGLLHCVLNYPTLIEHAELAQINVLQRTFSNCIIGYSDHVAPDNTISSLELATLLGAIILEKHFTHDKTLPGNDHYHAMDKEDLRKFIQKLEIYRRLYGNMLRDISNEAQARKHARRSIVASKNIEAGECLSEDNITTKRPGHGISPVFWDDVLGKKALKNIAEDTIIKYNFFS
ncbi:N-acetylneuraminate synthase family protein [Desulfatibacillum alkenivorans]|nr:N-acetylneuraminate synthase family protein [Desulfatibacillum alkenivorans]